MTADPLVITLVTLYLMPFRSTALKTIQTHLPDGWHRNYFCSLLKLFGALLSCDWPLYLAFGCTESAPFTLRLAYALSYQRLQSNSAEINTDDLDELIASDSCFRMHSMAL